MAQAADPAVELWLRGRWPGQPVVTAHLPGGDAIDAAAVPCAGCHGASAAGQQEAGVAAPPLAGTALQMPRQLGATYRPAYDLASFTRALRHGVDPRQIALAPAMPRYDLTDAQVSVLWQFLREGAPIPTPGLSGREVRVGVVLPTGVRGGSPLTGQNLFAVQVLQQATAVLARQGPIHDRSLRLVSLTADDLRDVGRLQASDRSVCAVLAPDATVDLPALTALLRTGALVIAPHPEHPIADHPGVLRLTPTQARTLPPLAHVDAMDVKKRCRQADLQITLPAWPAQPAPTVSRHVSAGLGRDQGRVAARLVVQFLQAAGRVVPHVTAWQDLPRNGRAWDAGLGDARISWGPRTHSGWSEAWRISLCARKPPVRVPLSPAK